MAKKESYRNVRKEKYTQVSNSLLNDKEATLQAKGLLSIFLSNSKDWEIHMQEIITRSKNGRDAHYKVIQELILLGYFARIQVMGKRFEEMIYLFSDIKEDVAEEIEAIQKWAIKHDKTLIIEYKTVKEKKEKTSTEKPFTEKQETENQYNNNTKSNNTNLNTNNKYIYNIDDDKRTRSTVHTEETLNLIISNFREATKGELTDRSFKSVVRKVIDKYNQGKVNSLRDYLATALIRKIEELELRRQKDNAKQQITAGEKRHVADKLNNIEIKKVPFYDWLAS